MNPAVKHALLVILVIGGIIAATWGLGWVLPCYQCGTLPCALCAESEKVTR